MRRSELKNLGLEADVIDTILEMNGDDINREKSKARKLEDELKDLKSQIGDTADVKKLEAERDSWKSKFEDLDKQVKTEKEEKEFNDFLKTNFDEYKDRTKEIKEQLTNVQKEKAYLFNSEDDKGQDSPTYTYIKFNNNLKIFKKVIKIRL